MKCPACPSQLSEITAYGLKVDVCTESCGGVWFDAGELERVDELHERVDSRVLRPLTNQKVVVDRNRPKDCPRCAGKRLKIELEDSLSEVEIDICPGCEGVWLDFGELATLREHNTASGKRAQVIDEYLNRYAKDPRKAPRSLRAVCELLFRG